MLLEKDNQTNENTFYIHCTYLLLSLIKDIFICDIINSSLKKQLNFYIIF